MKPFSLCIKLIWIGCTIAAFQSCGKATPEPVITASSSNVTKSSTGVTLQTGKNSAGSSTTTTTTSGTTTGGTTTGGTTTGGTTTGGTTTGGTTSGISINTNGDGGVAIGASGTVIFTLKGTTYKLTNDLANFQLVAATYLSSTGVTSIDNANLSGGGTSFGLNSTNAGLVGIYKMDYLQITLTDGTIYTSSSSPKGYVNFSTYSTKSDGTIATKGTFDTMLYLFSTTVKDSVRVSGSFNL